MESAAGLITLLQLAPFALLCVSWLAFHGGNAPLSHRFAISSWWSAFTVGALAILWTVGAAADPVAFGVDLTRMNSALAAVFRSSLVHLIFATFAGVLAALLRGRAEEYLVAPTPEENNASRTRTGIDTEPPMSVSPRRRSSGSPANDDGASSVRIADKSEPPTPSVKPSHSPLAIGAGERTG
ncbi:MAG: hypothetical protein HRU17_01065 [Polyangiaceae bacterium]|nr:hypothetical protein [Polyangiaceae bacterium]